MTFNFSFFKYCLIFNLLDMSGCSSSFRQVVNLWNVDRKKILFSGKTCSRTGESRRRWRHFSKKIKTKTTQCRLIHSLLELCLYLKVLWELLFDKLCLMFAVKLFLLEAIFPILKHTFQVCVSFKRCWKLSLSSFAILKIRDK